MFKFPKKLMVIDIEATGTTPNVSSMIQLGAVIVNQKGILEDTSFSGYILPYTPEWTEQAESVHKISLSKIQEIGEPLKKVLNDFENWASKLGFLDLKKTYWLAHWGASFDFSMLKSAYEFANIKFPFHYRSIDIASIVRFELAKQGKLSQKCSLVKCAKKYEISIETKNLHDALYDAKLTGKLLERISGAKKDF